MKLRSQVLTLALVAAVFAANVRAATETYVPDPPRSSVNFTVRHFFTKVAGTFKKVDATLRIDRDNLEQSSAEAVIDLTSVDTANSNRDAHLLKSEFFDAAKFPTITFKSKEWKNTGENEFNVTGDLTIKGVTRPVVLRVKSLGFGPGAMPGQMLSGWEATTKINRHDFGVSAFDKVIGADVEITINLEAVKKS